MSISPSTWGSTGSFNPSVGILGVQASATRASPGTSPCFNPSVGILGVQAGRAQPARAAGHKFQSLGRDSGCSSSAMLWSSSRSSCVSIPRSGFWVFKRWRPRSSRRFLPRFNPSVGILGVQALRSCARSRKYSQFQSLGRDSGCSSENGAPTKAVVRQFQSLGRDSGCSSM